jgi:hypothetical protein
VSFTLTFKNLDFLKPSPIKEEEEEERGGLSLFAGTVVPGIEVEVGAGVVVAVVEGPSSRGFVGVP